MFFFLDKIMFGCVFKLIPTCLCASISKKSHIYQLEILFSLIDDHYFIKFTLPVNAQGGKIEPRIVGKDVREYSKIDIGNFKEDLFFSPINSTEFTSVNDAVDIYLKTVENLLDKHAPCIQKKI